MLPITFQINATIQITQKLQWGFIWIPLTFYSRYLLIVNYQVTPQILCVLTRTIFPFLLVLS